MRFFSTLRRTGPLAAAIAISVLGLATAGAGPLTLASDTGPPPSQVVTTASTEPEASREENTPEDTRPSEQAPAHAADNAAEAQAFSGQIRAWTDCIATAAASAPTPRSDDFDPKAGCAHLAPGNAPGGAAFTPGADDGPDDDAGDAGRSGPPSSIGRPDGAGPPEGAGRPANPGPPAGAGPDSTEAPSGD